MNLAENIENSLYNKFSDWKKVKIPEVEGADCRNKIFYSQGIDLSDDGLRRQVVILLPHNDDRVKYLNLHMKTCYIKHFPIPGLDLLSSPDDDFLKEVAGIIKCELIIRICKPSNLVCKLVKSLLRHAEKTGCIDDGERNSVIKLCLKRLYEQNYRDDNLVVNILSTWYSPSQRYIEDLLNLNFHEVDFFRYILENCAVAGFNFLDFIVYKPPRSRSALVPVCPVLATVIRGDYTFLAFLLEYGFKRYETHIDNRNWRYVCTKMSPVLEGHRIKPLLHSYEDYREYLVHHRDYLITETLYMVCQSFLRTTEAWVECARLVFENIPDPYFSETELNNVFRLDSPPQFREEVHRRIRNLFSDIFVLELTPRTLIHLSRCAIRRALADNFQLPSGLNKLGLPKILARYVSLT